LTDADVMIPAFVQALVASLRAMLAPADGRDDERGQGLVEYGLILVLIAIVVIVVLGVVGHQVNNVFSNVSNGLNA
jgi:pilus assembly protein Flp/PilA